MTPRMTRPAIRDGQPGRNGRSTPRYRKLVAAVVLCVVAAGTLTGCSIAGNAAESWLEDNPIVESTSLSLDGCSATCDPSVKGGIQDSATEGEVRQLVTDATAYLAKSKSGSLDMVLEYQKVTIFIGRDQQQATEDADLAFVALRDDRLSSATIGAEFLSLAATRAAMTAVYRDYGTDARITVLDDATETSAAFRIGNEAGRECESSDSLISAFDSLGVNPVVTGVALDVCESLTVTIAEPAARESMVAALQPLASDPALAGVAFTILGDDQARFSVTATTAELAPFFDFLVATPGVTSYEARTTVINVEVADPTQLRSVALAIEAEPKSSPVGLVSVSTPGAAVYVNGDGTTAAQVGLVETVTSLVTRVSVYSSPGTIKLMPAPYSTAVGRQIVDAVLASGLSQSAGTEIALSGAGDDMVFTVEVAAGGTQFKTTRSDREPATDKAVAELNAYWVAQQAVAGP